VEFVAMLCRATLVLGLVQILRLVAIGFGALLAGLLQ
jgi:hypothetical protein